MTISYGSTAYGMGSQQCEDARKHGIAHLLGMEQKWGAYMGRTVFNDCKISLKKPMRLLYVFEQAGKDAEVRGVKDVAEGIPVDKNSGYLNWTVPVTNFPVKQYYVKGAVKRVYVQYGPPKGPKLSTGYYENTLQLNICHIENSEYAPGKQSQGASPNCIHSLDAAHLMMTSCAAPFPVTTIHDSFGALLCDMSDLFVVVREQFVELYKHKPLESLMKDIGGDISNVAIGDLDINLVLDSEYCFA